MFRCIRGERIYNKTNLQGTSIHRRLLFDLGFVDFEELWDRMKQIYIMISYIQ